MSRPSHRILVRGLSGTGSLSAFAALIAASPASIGPTAKISGSLQAWGEGQAGQLGDGNLTSIDLPRQVEIPAGLIVVRLSTGPTTRHSLAIVQRIYLS